MADLEKMFDRAKAGDPHARAITIRGAREHNLRNVDLLVARPELPRSLAASVEETVEVLGQLARRTGKHGEADRMARRRAQQMGRTRAGEVLVSGLHEYLRGFIRDTAQLHAAIGRQFQFV